MKTLDYKGIESALIDAHTLVHLQNQLQPEIESVKHAHGYDTPYASLHLPFDQAMHEKVLDLVKKKSQLKPAAVLLIGIGGSSLGAQAVYQACCGDSLPLYVADTIDSDYIYKIYKRIESYLEHNQHVICVVVSKSGTTTETVANFQLFLSLFQKHFSKKYADYFVAITDQGSALWKVAENHSFDRLAIPDLVGGRYSVFSPAGLFPLALVGIDITTLLDGARLQLKSSFDESPEKNPAALSAALIVAHYKKNIRIYDHFIFSMQLQGLGNWYRQLMGESIGKKYNNAQEETYNGITPTVSMGTVDLHSVTQLYLGGPYDRFTCFIHVQKAEHELVVPDVGMKLVGDLDNKKFTTVLDAVFQGTCRAYEKGRRPLIVMTLPQVNEFYVGAWLQLNMIQMMYIGYLLEVNPFDQPEVELYKEETRRILHNG